MTEPIDLDDGEIKQILASLFVACMCLRDRMTITGVAAEQYAKHACDLVDGLDAEFKKRGWSA